MICQVDGSGSARAAPFTSAQADAVIGDCHYLELRRLLVGGTPRPVRIGIVQSSEKLGAASDLLNERYEWRGYGRGHSISVDLHHITFSAEVEDETVGTLTLAVDGSSGLAADRVFGDHVARMRRGGAVPCELKRFAFSSSVQSKELMAALFHVVFVYGSRQHRCTDLLIEVNRRHVRFYESMLGFERVCEARPHHSLAIDVVLMRLDVAGISERIRGAKAATAKTAERSLYSYFFSPDEEEGVYNRLMRLLPPYAVSAIDARAA